MFFIDYKGDSDFFITLLHFPLKFYLLIGL